MCDVIYECPLRLFQEYLGRTDEGEKGGQKLIRVVRMDPMSSIGNVDKLGVGKKTPEKKIIENAEKEEF